MSTVVLADPGTVYVPLLFNGSAIGSEGLFWEDTKNTYVVIEHAVAIEVDIEVSEIVCVGKVEKSQYDVVADGIVEKGPRPPQKHQDEGLLFMPISELFPSLQIGAADDEADVEITAVLDAVRVLVPDTIVADDKGIVVEVGVVTVTDGLGDADVVKLED